MAIKNYCLDIFLDFMVSIKTTYNYVFNFQNLNTKSKVFMNF